jgi:hypothetical protein
MSCDFTNWAKTWSDLGPSQRNSTAAQDSEFLRNTRIEVEFDSEKRWSLIQMENNFSVLTEEIKCFGIGLRITLHKTYSNSYGHVSSLYISLNGRNSLLVYCPLVRGRRTKTNGRTKKTGVRNFVSLLLGRYRYKWFAMPTQPRVKLVTRQHHIMRKPS